MGDKDLERMKIERMISYSNRRKKEPRVNLEVKLSLISSDLCLLYIHLKCFNVLKFFYFDFDFPRDSKVKLKDRV